MSLVLNCPSCQATGPVERVSTAAGIVSVLCAECGEKFVLDADGSSTSIASDRPAEEDDAAFECAKCQTVQPVADACRACGLLRERMDDYEPQHDGDGDLDEMWAKVESNWDDDDAHESFLSAAIAGGSLSQAARRYRAIAKSDARARRYLDRIASMAAALMVASAKSANEDEERTPYKLVAVFLLFLLVLALAIGAFLIIKRGGEPQELGAGWPSVHSYTGGGHVSG